MFVCHDGGHRTAFRRARAPARHLAPLPVRPPLISGSAIQRHGMARGDVIGVLSRISLSVSSTRESDVHSLEETRAGRERELTHPGDGKCPAGKCETVRRCAAQGGRAAAAFIPPFFSNSIDSAQLLTSGLHRSMARRVRSSGSRALTCSRRRSTMPRRCQCRVDRCVLRAVRCSGASAMRCGVKTC